MLMVGLQSPGRETLGNLRVELGKGKACKRDEPQLGGYNAIGSKALISMGKFPDVSPELYQSYVVDSCWYYYS